MHMKSKLTEVQFAKVKKYLGDKRRLTTKEIAEICGVSVTSVSRIRTCDSWDEYEANKTNRYPRNIVKKDTEEMEYVKAYLKSMSEKLLQLSIEFEEFSNAINKKEI